LNGGEVLGIACSTTGDCIVFNPDPTYFHTSA